MHSAGMVAFSSLTRNVNYNLGLLQLWLKVQTNDFLIFFFAFNTTRLAANLNRVSATKCPRTNQVRGCRTLLIDCCVNAGILSDMKPGNTSQ
jgi:hypothetical protein